MNDSDKLTAILEYVKQFKKFNIEKDYPEDIQSNSGGNFDDAYQIGVDHGERSVATEIMDILGI